MLGSSQVVGSLLLPTGPPFEADRSGRNSLAESEQTEHVTEPLIDALYWAAGRWAFGREPIEPVIRLACDLLVTGYNGEHVVTLAGISVSETERDGQVRRDVEMALEELGRPLPAEGTDDAYAIASGQDPAEQRLLGRAMKMLVDDLNAVYPGLLWLVTPGEDKYGLWMVRDYQGVGTGLHLDFASTIHEALWEVDQQLAEPALEAWWGLTGQGSVPYVICGEHPDSGLHLGERDDIPVWVCSVGDEVIATVGELRVAGESGQALPGLTR